MIDKILEKENTSEIYFNGSKWQTNNFGEVEIIGKSIKKNFYIYKFKDGTIAENNATNIQIGKIKNYNYPLICNIGYMGYGKYTSTKNKKITKEYSVWSGMLKRCYDEKTQKRQPSYIGCSVDKRWHNFQNFCKDIEKLEGYNEWKNNQEIKYELDKDIKVKGNKIYSKNTCKFVTVKENCSSLNRKQNTTGLTYIGTRILDNYQEEFTNQSEFARKYNLFSSPISACILKKYQSTKGWKFKIKEKEKI